MKRPSIPFAALVAAAAGWAGAVQADAGLPPRLAALDPAAAEARVALADDALEFEAVLSTEPVFRSRRGLLRYAWNDNHLRAVVDKRTGAVRYEVRQTLNYAGRMRGYDRAHYPGPAGLAAAAALRIDDNEGLCLGALGPDGQACPVREDVAFEVDADALRRAVDAGRPLHFRLKAARGPDHTASLAPAEISGLLAAVDAYRRRTGLAPQLAALADPSARP